MDIDDANNEGHELRRQLEQTNERTGQRTWGFVIYRCTYGDDDAWARFMKIVNERVRESLEAYDTPELMETLDWPVQEDRATLEGASKDVVRQHFRRWVAGAPGHDDPFSPRFRYCIQVDAESLKSVVTDAPQPPEPDLDSIGCVNMIEGDWTLDEDEEEDDGGEEIEGCTQHNVGWIRVPVCGLAPRTYSMFGDDAGWDICYVRPPDVTVP